MEERKQHHWGALGIGYLFLAGLGAMTFTAAALLDLLGIEAARDLNGWISLAALVVTAIGALFLLLELGNKFKFFLVFTNPSSIMTLGAYILMLFMIASLVYTTFFFDFIPWSGLDGLKGFVAVVGIIAALLLVTYPGIELGGARGRTFWNGSALVPLFLIATGTTGLAGTMLAFVLLGKGEAEVVGVIDKVLFGFLLALLIAVIGYILGMRHSGREGSERAVRIILQGLGMNTFFIGYVAVGTLAPLLTYLWSSSPDLLGAKAILVIVGGLCLRIIFLQAAVQPGMPGEDREWYEEREIKALAKKLDKRWAEKASWLNPPPPFNK